MRVEVAVGRMGGHAEEMETTEGPLRMGLGRQQHLWISKLTEVLFEEVVGSARGGVDVQLGYLSVSAAC